MKKTWMVLGSLTAALAGCGEDEGAAGTVWLGATPHLEAEGSIGGPAIDLSVGGAEAADVAVLYCERNYVAGLLEKIEVKYVFTYDGMPAELEISLADLDFAAEPAPVIVVGSADPAARTASDIDVELQIETEDGTEINDVATSGTFSLEALEGTPGVDGLIPSGEGAFGGVFDVELESGGTLSVSFYANCGDNDVE